MQSDIRKGEQMADPVMSALLQTGGLSIQELFARVGGQLSNRLRVASLLKSGEVRLEFAPEREPQQQFLTPSSSEEEIASQLEALISATDSASEIEVVPTVKAWRSSSAA